jgi:predicted metalloprotease with PDZ domain
VTNVNPEIVAKMSPNGDLIYRVRPDRPQARVFAVGLVVPGSPTDPLELSMPTWIAGSYMTWDFARNIVSITARRSEAWPR